MNSLLKIIVLFAYHLTAGGCLNFVFQSETHKPLDFAEVMNLGLTRCMQHYEVPGCTWAVIRSGEIDTLGAEGVIFNGSEHKIHINNRFQIGSMGKSYTSLIAAKCVEEGLIDWDSLLFDILPEWKEHSRIEYYSITLRDLLSHKTRLQALNSHKTHIDKRTNSLVYEDIPNFEGSDFERRQQFCRYALGLDPVAPSNFNYANSGYCIAGAMLEKVTGKTWEELAIELADSLDIKIGFERPNQFDSLQPWGHMNLKKRGLEQISPTNNKIYNDPMNAPAGNLHLNIADFSNYVLQFMNGLKGEDGIVSANTFRFLLGGLDAYSMGWFNENKREQIYYHYGSEGTFYCHMMIFADLDAAIVIFTNGPGNNNTLNFINDARNYLKEKHIYSKND